MPHQSVTFRFNLGDALATPLSESIAMEGATPTLAADLSLANIGKSELTRAGVLSDLLAPEMARQVPDRFSSTLTLIPMYARDHNLNFTARTKAQRLVMVTVDEEGLEGRSFDKGVAIGEIARKYGVPIPSLLLKGAIPSTALVGKNEVVVGLLSGRMLRYRAEEIGEALTLEQIAKDGWRLEYGGWDTEEIEALFPKVGEAVHKIHAISTKGYGHVFDPASGSFASPSWSSYWDEQMSPEVISLLNTHLTPTESEEMVYRLKRLKEWNFEPRLIHGTLTQYNILGTKKADNDAVEVKLVGWEGACSGPAPHWELAKIILQEPYSLDSSPYFGAVLEGMGLTRVDYEEKYQTKVRELAFFTAASKLVLQRESGSDILQLGGAQKFTIGALRAILADV